MTTRRLSIVVLAVAACLACMGCGPASRPSEENPKNSPSVQKNSSPELHNSRRIKLDPHAVADGEVGSEGASLNG